MEQERVIPSTRRPDGTWRKEIRVRAGYTPQDEIGAFETTASRMKSGKKNIPGYHPPVATVPETKSQSKKTSHPKDLVSNSEKQSVDSTLINQMKIIEINNTSNDEINPDQTKRLRKIKKKLREIHDLESKLQSCSIDSTEEIQKKISQKEALECEIATLEARINS